MTVVFLSEDQQRQEPAVDGLVENPEEHGGVAGELIVKAEPPFEMECNPVAEQVFAGDKEPGGVQPAEQDEDQEREDTVPA